jgi:ferredoxin
MKTTLTTSLCAALVSMLAWSHPTLAQQKSVKQCSSEWTADKPAIRASGRTKKVFMAECRGLPVVAAERARKSASSSEGQYATESEARASCPTDTIVWVNLSSKIYHAGGSRSFGKTKRGAYMCEKESVAAGFRPPKISART